MKHKSNKNNQHSILVGQDTSKHLVNAATVLIEKVKDPAEFVSLLILLLDGLNELESKIPGMKERDYQGNIKCLTRELLPGLMGEDKNRLHNLSEGLKSFMDGFGYACLQETTASIVMAYGYGNIAYGYGSPECQLKELHSINVLFEMARHMYYYEQEENERIEKQKQAA